MSGLFKENKRFGPGVFTDSAGYQDVGLWYGPTLRRLISTSVPEKEIPRLAYSLEGKKALAAFRKLLLIENVSVKISCEANLLNDHPYSNSQKKIN